MGLSVALISGGLCLMVLALIFLMGVFEPWVDAFFDAIDSAAAWTRRKLFGREDT